VDNDKANAVAALREADRPSVSSGDRGRPIADLIERFEKADPEAVVEAGFSSAAMRAGEWVRRIRKASALTQTALADKVNVTQERISEIERGEGPQGPTISLLDRIAKACGREITLVFGTLSSSTAAIDRPLFQLSFRSQDQLQP